MAISTIGSNSLNPTSDLVIDGVTIGRGNGSVSTNTAVGASALAANTTGATSVAVGSGALQAGTSASSNTAVGYQAGYSNTTAAGHSFFGYGAGYSNTTGANNSFFGINAGRSTTTGNRNTLVGTYTGYNLTTGSGNTFIGTTGASDSVGCGYYMTTGNNNVIIGGYTGNGGLDIRTSSNYIVLSDGDGNPRLWCNGIGNWVIGSSANTINVGTYGVTVQGSTGAMLSLSRTDLDGTARNMQIFNSNTTQVGLITCTTSATAYGTSSDYRLKENVQPMTGALDKVSALKPCTYTWKVDGSASQGFIAHELAEVCPEAVMGEKDAVNEDGSIKPQGIDTSFLVATLTAAIQELNAKVDAQAAEIAALKGQA